MNESGMIFRKELVSYLDQMSKSRIIYVCAPAGYGKTAVVRQWLDGLSGGKTSISLDDYDNNPAHFCRRFCAALSACQDKNPQLHEIVTHPAFNTAPDEFSLRAIAALPRTKHHTQVFAIDDLQSIHNEAVLRLLLILLGRLPENFQIVLISRNDLPPGFSDLWVRGNLAHVTADRLRFNSEEISLLYKKRGRAVTPEQADRVYDLTGGWAIGINALLLSGDLPSGGSLDYLERFIRTNVWDKWDEDIREFMVITSAAYELHPSLCDEPAGVTDSEIRLRELMKSGAFISRTRDGAYHYHQLFRDFFGAAECFIRSRNPDGLGETIGALAMTNRESFVIERLLPILQTTLFYEAAIKRPGHFAYMLWASLAAGKAKEMDAYADQFYARFPEILEKDPGRASYIFLVYFIDYRISLSTLVKEAMTLPVKQSIISAPGSVSMNMPFIHRCARDFSEIAAEDMEPTVAKMKELIGWVFGEEAHLLVECLKAGIYYEQGCLETAHLHAIEANAAIREHFMPEVKFCAMSLLIVVLDALGQSQAAEEVIGRLAVLIETDMAYYLNTNFKALSQRRKLENGDMQAARDWLKEHGANLNGSLSFYGIYNTFTTCRAYMTYGDYDSAIILLKKVLELAKTYGRPLDIIESQILLAIAYWKKKRGFQGKAMEYLEDAVSRAYGFGYTQLFINEGSELSGMMKRLLGRVEQPSANVAVPVSFVKMLYLKTLEHVNSGLTSGQTEPPVAYTEKQMAVMRLICQGKSYREITDILGIKLSTLRSHIALIYKKLDVTNETDAVIKIRTQGLLDGRLT